MSQNQSINHEIYSNYLNEHYLGSEGGINAFRAAAAAWNQTPHENTFKSLCQQVMADRDDLRRIINQLGYHPHPFKNLLTHVVRILGRLNPVNVLRKRRTGMAQIELEVLIGMLRAKLSMWETLLLVSAKDPRLIPSCCKTCAGAQVNRSIRFDRLSKRRGSSGSWWVQTSQFDRAQALTSEGGRL